jgi:hypothetical protein
MIMKRISSRGADVALTISHREPFVTSGALKGGDLAHMGPGRLTGDDLAAFRRDRDAITYAVYSYVTPIAWFANEQWHRVEQRFTVTTAKHQSRLYMIDTGTKGN